MSDEAVEEDAGSKKGKKGKKEGKEKGAKSNLLPAIVLAIGMVGAGYMLGPGSGSGEAAGAGTDETTTTSEPIPGEIVQMEPININLAGGHYLKVGMALQLAEGVLAEEFAKGKTAKANDILIAEVGGRDMAELATPEGRAKLKEDLREKIMETYREEETGDEVIDLFFTDFVMQ